MKPIKVVRNNIAIIERYAPTKQGEEEVWTFEILEQTDPENVWLNPLFELTQSQVDALITLINDAKKDDDSQEVKCSKCQKVIPSNHPYGQTVLTEENFCPDCDEGFLKEGVDTFFSPDD